MWIEYKGTEPTPLVRRHMQQYKNDIRRYGLDHESLRNRYFVYQGDVLIAASHNNSVMKYYKPGRTLAVLFDVVEREKKYRMQNNIKNDDDMYKHLTNRNGITRDTSIEKTDQFDDMHEDEMKAKKKYYGR